MPQLQNLVLTDRATPTPVNHTFTPLGIDPKTGVAALEESTGVPFGAPKYTLLTRRVNGRFKVTLRLSVPIMATATVNGVSTPVIVRTSYVDSTFTFEESSSEQERKDVVGQFADSLAAGKALVNDTLVKLQGVY